MLQCTTLRSVVPADARRTFFWSEIVTLHVTIAFNPAAASAHKTELHTQHGGATAADAWARAATRICEAALVSTSVSTTGSTSQQKHQQSQLTRPPTSSSVMMGTRQRQQVEPVLISSSSDAAADQENDDANSSSSSSIPSVTFTVTFSIPYSSSAATSPLPLQQLGDGTSAAATSSSFSSSYLCEWEILLIIASTSGPTRAPMQHCDVFGLLRYTLPVLSALQVSSRTVACGACSGTATTTHGPSLSNSIRRSSAISPSNTPAKMMAPGLGAGSSNAHRVIAVQCRNCCDHHVSVQHVALENSMWVAAATLHQQTSKATTGAASMAVSATNPWVVRHRNESADEMVASGSKQPPQLMALCDPLPITLKPSECYTFCFDYVMAGGSSGGGGADDEKLQLVVRTTIASRPVLINHTLKL